MTNREQLIQMINNLNENGIDLLLYFFGDMDKKERYNINTTPERVAELKQMEEQEKAEREAERERASLGKCRQEEEFKASLTGKEKRFFETIDSIKPGTRYALCLWELELLSRAYNNSLFEGGYDAFKYGFLKGQKFEINRRKAIAN